MPDTFEKLNKIRLKLSTALIEAQILFKQINNSDITFENAILSELGEKICINTREDFKNFEIILDNLKK